MEDFLKSASQKSHLSDVRKDLNPLRRKTGSGRGSETLARTPFRSKHRWKRS